MENSMINGIDLKTLYVILRDVAKRKEVMKYGELSNAYFQKTSIWREPHGTWDHPLGALNTMLSNKKLPAMSALVVTADTLEPGKGFWGSCLGVDAWISHDGQRMEKLLEIQKLVYATKWPYSLPSE